MDTVELKTLKLFYRGKARDVYEINDNMLLICVTDRISCFDYVLPTLIPDKGKILNKMSAFWFKYISDIIEHHMISTDWDEISKIISNEENIDYFKDRCMIVKKTKKINIECVVRGYLSGSAWKEYESSGKIYGQKLPDNLKESDKLPEPIFTPAIKSMSGHDINITEEQMALNEGEEITQYLKEKSLLLYKKVSEYAYKRGIIIADTKFEFGITPDNKIILIDEIFTPDSSRFWDRNKYSPGKSQDSYDKQFVRDYLESINWNKQPPVPELPDDIVEKTREKYIQAYKILIGPK